MPIVFDNKVTGRKTASADCQGKTDPLNQSLIGHGFYE